MLAVGGEKANKKRPIKRRNADSRAGTREVQHELFVLQSKEVLKEGLIYQNDIF